MVTTKDTLHSLTLDSFCTFSTCNFNFMHFLEGDCNSVDSHSLRPVSLREMPASLSNSDAADEEKAS